jgi:hypothetical protein
MRLDEVATGHRLRERLKLLAMRVVGRQPPADIMKTLLYRPELFGRPLSALAQASLRGPSEWTLGERELMGAYVSRLNRCLF